MRKIQNSRKELACVSPKKKIPLGINSQYTEFFFSTKEFLCCIFFLMSIYKVLFKLR